MTSSARKPGKGLTMAELRDKYEELKRGAAGGVGAGASALKKSFSRTLRMPGLTEPEGSDAYYLRLDGQNFEAGLETKICGYVRLYTSFINAGRKFLLAHNRFVSVFNLVKEQWVAHHLYEGYVQQIFRNRIDYSTRKPQAGGEPGKPGPDAPTFDIGVLVGNQAFAFMRLASMGKIKVQEQRVALEGTVLDFAVDQQNDTGFYFTLQ